MKIILPYDAVAKEEMSKIPKEELGKYCAKYKEPAVSCTIENVSLFLEGLIHTYPVDKTIQFVQKSLNGIPILIRPIESENGQQIQVTFPSIGNNFNIIVNLMNLCGYYLGAPKFNSENYPKDVILSLQFEPKNQDKNRDILGHERTLLHITQTKNLSKIKKIGLVPSAKNRMFNYPDRIYFIKGGLPEAKVLGLATMLCYVKKHEAFKNGAPIKEDYSILTLDISKIPERVKFTIDPNFGDGFYTTDNIPPSAIIDEKKITITRETINTLFPSN